MDGVGRELRAFGRRQEADVEVFVRDNHRHLVKTHMLIMHGPGDVDLHVVCARIRLCS